MGSYGGAPGAYGAPHPPPSAPPSASGASSLPPSSAQCSPAATNQPAVAPKVGKGMMELWAKKSEDACLSAESMRFKVLVKRDSHGAPEVGMR